MRKWLAAFALVPVVACAASASNEAEDDDDDSTSTGTGGTGGGLNLGGSISGGGGPTDTCSDEAKLIYVLSDTNQLYSFKPDERLFTLIGPLGCNTTMSPNSMAVDRDAVAWVNYVDGGLLGDNAGAIYRVSTADASCEPTPAVTLPAGWYRIGMGYSTDGANTDAETLFVTSIGLAGGLGRIDGPSLTPIGEFGGAFYGQTAELTGTGDGRLFGFFTSTPVEVGEIDKASAQVIANTPLPTVQVPSAWAFSFWGGDFYLYTANMGDSTVNRYRPSDGSVDTAYMTNIGFRIVGAGVSTCAPLQPPR
ncbi:MAG: hypothetical protein JRI23_06105 [Deltaproteobacteria bacterium]|jgi:hypothetical protein|nr:hypothetical protein [Deltaproteobacteria bacterium]MBW2531144.1 hypothetical protein [Deltaproteobacteria bacterium]